MKNIKTVAIVVALATASSIYAQTRQTRQEYIERYKHIAIEHMEYYGIPASITMAQGILESSSGNSELSKSSNNHFGIKCKTGWSGRKVYFDDDEAGECFRAYKTVEESYRDHAIFLDSSPRYDSLFAYSTTDYKSWARGLKAAGYATAPHYANTLIKIIEDEKLYLLDQKGGENLYAKRHNEEIKVEETPTESTAIVDPDNFAVTINAHKGYDIERTNGLYFTRAKSGDTAESIADTFEISRHNIRRFNDLKRDEALSEGDIIFIERKKKTWEGDTKRTHQAAEGETLYSIAQQYGVRLKSLRRLNKLDKKTEIATNQIVIIK